MKRTAKKVWCIYKHTNKSNGKGYIGKAIFPPSNRWGKCGKNYLNQPVFGTAIKKYGWDNFEHTILLSGLSAEEAIDAEICLIHEHNTFCGISSGHGYNMTLGGEGMGGWHHSKEEIERRSGGNSLFARPVVCCPTGELFDTVTLAAEKYRVGRSLISSAAHGHQKTAGNLIWCFSETWNQMTEEQRLHYILDRSISNKKGERNHKSVSVINCLTDEVFPTITAAQEHYHCKTVGNAINDYDRVKKSGGQVWCKLELWELFSDEEKLAYVADKISDVRIGKTNPSAKAVVNLLTGEIFSTMKDAAAQYSCSAGKICSCCTKVNRTAGGQVWLYFSEYESMSEIERAHYLEDCLCRSENPAKHGKAAKGIVNLTTGKVYKTLLDASTESGLSKYSLIEICKRKQCSWAFEVWILKEDYDSLDSDMIQRYFEGCLAKGPLAKKNRPVKNNNTGEIFIHAKDAAKAYSCDYSRLLKCCKGIVSRVGGCSWSFADE